MIINILVCIIIPLLFFSLILDNNARRLMIFIIVGTLSCFLAYLLNNAVYDTSKIDYFYLTTTVAPIIEETLKFIPILLASIYFSAKKEIVLPLGFALGIGFAITENFYMILTGNSDVVLTILRGLGSGLMHALSSSIIALGICKVKQYPRLKIVGIVASLFLAIQYHGLYNCMVNSNNILKYLGIILPLLTYTVLFVIYRKDLIKNLLKND